MTDFEHQRARREGRELLAEAQADRSYLAASQACRSVDSWTSTCVQN